MTSISTTAIHIEGNVEIWNDLRSGEETEGDNTGETNRQSLYVEIFKSIQEIVMQQEAFLFSLEEQACLHNLAEAMSYPALYLLIRLCLRKRGKWHSLASLEQRYKIEIGGKELISKAIDELCGVSRSTPVEVKEKQHDIIDLTLDDGEGSGVSSAIKGNTPAAAPPSTHQSLGNKVHAFAEDETTATLPQLLGCLTHDELKCIGKQLKVAKACQNRSALTDAILSNASNQSILTFPVLTPRNNAIKSRGNPMLQLTLNFPRNDVTKAQATIIRQLVSKTLGRCIRISPEMLTLFDRLNIIFFRCTTHSSSLLLPALLTAFRKRSHVETDYVRTASIFASRQALLDYEEALTLEARVDEALSGESPATVHTPKPSSDVGSKEKVKQNVPLKTSCRVEGAKVVREIWKEIYDRWKALVSCKDEEVKKSPRFERFECGHVLTRIVCKGAEALAILKEYDLEAEVLEELLAQTKWRRGRRGAWYDRLALVLMTHLAKTQNKLEMAMEVVINGLQDELTHLTYRPRLERRLTRLEKKLRVPVNERHKCDGHLKKAQDIYLEGVRVKSRASSVILDKSGRIQGATAPPAPEPSWSGTQFTKSRASRTPIEETKDGVAKNLQSWRGKSLWIGKLGEEISVERFALEHYYDVGYKGFHSEGRIVSTIFGLLFWDVIFASVPGAFETPYQTAPLDIFEDSFYTARRELVDNRLNALENGEAQTLLDLVYKKQYQTLCIGVDWDFRCEDLLEIVDCLGGHSLAIICQMICEDYGQWRGGVPDLVVWKAEGRECRFVEVKSPNDKLQENQKVWIDVLVGSGALVDLCHVAEKGGKGKRKSSRAHGRMKDVVLSDDVESEDEIELESGEEDMKQLNLCEEEQVPRRKRNARNSDDFTPPPMKKRKTDVLITTRRARPRKRSST